MDECAASVDRGISAMLKVMCLDLVVSFMDSCFTRKVVSQRMLVE